MSPIQDDRFDPPHDEEVEEGARGRHGPGDDTRDPGEGECPEPDVGE